MPYWIDTARPAFDMVRSVPAADVMRIVDAAAKRSPPRTVRAFTSGLGSRRSRQSSGSRTRRMRVPVARISFCSFE